MEFDLNKLETGDILGQSYSPYKGSFGEASRVFELATKSKFSHVGVVHVSQGWFGSKKINVIHADPEGVMEVPFVEVIGHTDGKFAIYRYKNGLNELQKAAIVAKAREWTKEWYQFWKSAKKYDFTLSPGDDELYCSELVDEAYRAVGISLSNKYWSVRELHATVYKLFKQGEFEKRGLAFKSAKEATRKVIGEKGFYQPSKEVMFRAKIISPGDIICNSNTVVIFDNV